MRDFDQLVRRAEARWAEIVDERPDLEPAVALQRTLVLRTFELLRALENGDPPAFTVRATDVAGKLARGVPALCGLSVPLPVSRLAPHLQDFCDDLADGGAGEAARHIGDALKTGRIDPGPLLMSSLARNQQGIRSGAIQMGLAPDLVWLVAELAAGPIAHRLQQTLLPGFGIRPSAGPWHHELVGERDSRCELGSQHSGLSTDWDRGYCPVCGSWPALVEVCDGHPMLRCAFCAAFWRLSSYRCPYCGGQDEVFATMAPDSARPDRRLALCDACKGYVKVVDLVGATPFPLLAIEDLATSNLDVAAMSRGYNRPPLLDISV